MWKQVVIKSHRSINAEVRIRLTRILKITKVIRQQGSYWRRLRLKILSKGRKLSNHQRMVPCFRYTLLPLDLTPLFKSARKYQPKPKCKPKYRPQCKLELQQQPKQKLPLKLLVPSESLSRVK